MTSPEGDHQANGLAEVGVREIKAQTRILRSQLEQRLGSRIDEKDPLMSWIPRHAANCVSRYRIMDDGRTPDQRRCGRTWKRPVVEFGESVQVGLLVVMRVQEPVIQKVQKTVRDSRAAFADRIRESPAVLRRCEAAIAKNQKISDVSGIQQNDYAISSMASAIQVRESAQTLT